MKSMAMYVGFRPYERKERTLEDGTVIKATKGTQYLFYCSEWYDGGEIDDMGRTRFETVLDENKGEDRAKELATMKPGTMCTVRIRENFGQRADNACTYINQI